MNTPMTRFTCCILAVAESNAMKFLRMENNAAVCAVGSGVYRFQSTLSENDT
jgi:hypothetical protein